MTYIQTPLSFGHPLLGVVLLLTLTLALATQAASATPESSADSVGEDGEPTNDPAKDPAVVSLVNDLGVSTSQAISQMETQVAAGRAERDMPPGLAAVFSDREIQHSQGGNVVVAMTDRRNADAMRDHFASYGVSDIDIRIVQHTNHHLDATAEDMQRRLRNARKPQDTTHAAVGRASLGTVTVEFVDGPMNATEEEVLSEARADPDTFTVIEVDHIDTGELDACDRMDNIECDPPLRGSVWMFNNDVGTCSAGFNVRSSSDAKPYVLSAGHCDQATSSWYTRFADGSNHFIGPFHNSIWNSTADTGILQVDNPSGWQFGKPWITVNPNGDGHTANDSYVISDVQNPSKGDRACVTAGNFPATTCGTVTDTLTPGSTTGGLFRVSEDLCLMSGDSGSPYFSFGVAYGTHIESQSGANCGEWGKAEHARESEDLMNVYILTG